MGAACVVLRDAACASSCVSAELRGAQGHAQECVLLYEVLI